jgi:hypothetical protein
LSTPFAGPIGRRPVPIDSAAGRTDQVKFAGRTADT